MALETKEMLLVIQNVQVASSIPCKLFHFQQLLYNNAETQLFLIGTAILEAGDVG